MGIFSGMKIEETAEEDFGVVRRWVSDEVQKGWVDNEREREREKEEDTESEEVARVSVEDAL